MALGHRFRLNGIYRWAESGGGVEEAGTEGSSAVHDGTASATFTFANADVRSPGSNVRAIPHRYAREVPTTANAAVGSSTANADNDAKIECARRAPTTANAAVGSCTPNADDDVRSESLEPHVEPGLRCVPGRDLAPHAWGQHWLRILKGPRFRSLPGSGAPRP